MGTTTSSQSRRQGILVFRAAPPTVVSAKVTHRHHHVIDNAVSKIIGSHKEVGTMLCFAQNVRNTVGILRFTHVIGIMVFVTVRIGSRHHRKHHKGISLSLGFLKVVTAVVPTALQGSFFRSKTSNSPCPLYKRTCTILGMAGFMEPGFRITRTVNTVELQGRITDHGVNFIANDKCRRILVKYFNTVTSIGFKARGLGQITDTNLTGRAFGTCRIAFLISRCSIGTGLNYPARARRQS